MIPPPNYKSKYNFLWKFQKKMGKEMQIRANILGYISVFMLIDTFL